MPGDSHDQIFIAAPDIGPAEEEAVLRVLRSGRLAQGPEVAAFEEEFAAASEVDHAIAVANGTVALQVALHVAGIEAGDEVLIPAFTFAATANAVVGAGARPVFVDIDADYHIDLDHAATLVTDRTAAVMPVHLYGLMTDMDAVAAFATKYGLAIIEDAAQAHLATRGGHVAGGTGIGAFSLYATKNMMTGEGGIVTTNDDDVAAKARLFRNHGMPERYVHTEWGLNYRLTDLQAAIGRAQLVKLPDATKQRIANAAFYTEHLPTGLTLPTVPADATHVFHQYTVAIGDGRRDDVLAALRERGIGAEVYYPTSVPEQESFAPYAGRSETPRAIEAGTEVLSLPVHPRVGAAGLERVVEAMTELVG